MDKKKRVFVSYSHLDQAWCETFRAQLGSVQDPVEFDVWIDQQKIRVGDKWNDEINKGLEQADVAVLLISANFLNSPFIRQHEQPRLLARREAGLLVVPVLVGECPWENIRWLSQSELRPLGARPLERIGKPDSPKVKAVVAAIVNQITERLKAQDAPSPGATPAGEGLSLAPSDGDAHQATAQDLLRQVLLSAMDEAGGVEVARALVAGIGRFTGLGGTALLRATRVFVEFHLLRSDEPTSAPALLRSLELMPGDKMVKKLLNELKRGADTGGYSQCVIDVSSMFFMLARERESLWQAYFEWQQRQPALAAGAEISTVAGINVLYGFIAPQFLVAGLMSRFNDDWRPVLSTYARAMPDPSLPRRAFESLQASQWNLWLVWGPSIPICRCAQWQGRFAFQYGYGDENNSLPLIELEEDEQHQPKILDPLTRQLLLEHRGSAPVKLSGRLRWGPQFLRGSESSPPGPAGESSQIDDVDPDDDDDPDTPPARPASRWLMADAQTALFCGSEVANQYHSDGLILQLNKVEGTSSEPRAYFSAYLWMMFLVAGPLADGDDTGPRLLWQRAYPPWPEVAGDRAGVQRAGLWRNLLPIFVHANIADPAALRIQRRMLTHTALAMLRQLWADRENCFDPDDVRQGIRFHLVCASDYTGCGDQLRYPPEEALGGLMRDALNNAPDRDFAASVVMPPRDEAAEARPWGLAGYYSSCHLPELVLDYFDHVAQLQSRPTRRP
jgi:TIR domain